jgi:hypothetical protein
VSPPMNGEPVLRVLMTADAVGGVWSYALDLAAGLRPYGVETTLAVLGPCPSADQREAAERAGVVLLATELPLDWTAATPHEVEEAGHAIERMTHEVKPDILHLNSPALAAGTSFTMPVVAVCHSCVATWWQAVRSGPLPEDFLWRTDLVRRGYLAADALLAPTAAFAAMTARAYGLTLPPGVVHNGRRQPTSHETSRDGVFAFTAGRLWDEGKNVAAIDRAAARLHIPILAAGDIRGPNGVFVDTDHVWVLGRINDMEI